MLVLSRQIDEGIRIGPDSEAVIRIVDIRGDKVRIGIDAPRNWQIHREEVWLAIEAEQGRAEKPPPDDCD